MKSQAGFPEWPFFEADEIEAVGETLDSGRVNYWSGEQGELFEQEFAAYCGVRHAIALSSGSVALEIALRAVGVGPGDEVIVTPRSFIASASSVCNVGAHPVFVDIELESQNLAAGKIEAALTARTRAIVPVHLAGWPCAMDEINALAGANELLVIEDCAQAHGATLAGRRVGSFGDAAAFSFCNDKIINTGGEGGMLVTDDPALWERAWSLKEHGKQHALIEDRNSKPSFQWLHRSFGSNARMTEMQACIGRLQLSKLEGWLAQRRANAATLDERLGGLELLRIPRPPERVGHAYYKYYLFVRHERLRRDWSRERLVEAMRTAGITCGTGVCPEIYLELAFQQSGNAPSERLPVARQLSECSLVLEVHPRLTPVHMERIASLVADTIERATA